MSRTIVVGWALDAAGRRAVELAADLSRGGRLYLVHVAAPDPDFVPWEAGPAGERARMATEFRDEHRALQGLAEDLRAQGAEVTALLVQGATAAALVDEAHRRRAELLVIGTRGRRGLAKLILGSVAEEVLRCADLPVVVVPLERS